MTKSSESIIDPGLARILAPSGELRAAINLGNPVLAHRTEGGVLAGVTVELARALAATLGVGITFIPYESGGAATRGLSIDRWDIGFLAGEPERAKEIQFTEPYLVIDGTCMVRSAGPYTSFSQLDRTGVRIAVGDGAAYHHILRRILKHAELVTTPTSAAAIALFEAAGLDAAAGVRQTLERAAMHMPIAPRVLADNFSQIFQTVAVPRDRTDNAQAYVAAFIRACQRDGSIKEFLARDGQSGVAVLTI